MAKDKIVLAVSVNKPDPPPTPNNVDEPMPGMGALCSASGTVTPPVAATDTLAEVLLYNDTNLGGSAPDPDTMRSNGGTANTVPVAGTNDLDWSISGFSGGVPPTKTPPTSPNNFNNILYVLAGWDRDMGNGIYERIWDPSTGSPPVAAPQRHNYLGQQGSCTTDKGLKATKESSARLISTEVTANKRRGRWLIYRDLPAMTTGQGHQLHDENGLALHASEIAIYAFDVDWRYKHLNVPTVRQIDRHVHRPIGDILSTSETGLMFPASATNSLILWQANSLIGPPLQPKHRTVIISQSKSKPDIVDLDRSRGIYLHWNYQRSIPMLVEGSFSVAVRVLRS